MVGVPIGLVDMVKGLLLLLLIDRGCESNNTIHFRLSIILYTDLFKFLIKQCYYKNKKLYFKFRSSLNLKKKIILLGHCDMSYYFITIIFFLVRVSVTAIKLIKIYVFNLIYLTVLN